MYWNPEFDLDYYQRNYPVSFWWARGNGFVWDLDVGPTINQKHLACTHFIEDENNQ